MYEEIARSCTVLCSFRLVVIKFNLMSALLYAQAAFEEVVTGRLSCWRDDRMSGIRGIGEESMVEHFARKRTNLGARLASIVGALSFIFASAPSMAAGPIQIDLTYDSEMDMVRPENHPGIAVHHNLHVTFVNGKGVTENRDRNAGRYQDKNSMTQAPREEAGYATWRVLSQDKLMRIERDPQSTRTMIVTLTSASTCTLEVKDELKSGFNEYAFLRISTHSLGYFSSYRVVGTSCTIR
jgi:hypothetical protein